MTIINIISAVSIGSLQFLTSYQSLSLPHEYVVALISFGGDLVTPCIKSSINSYVPFLFKVDHKLRDFCLKKQQHQLICAFFTFKLTICYVTSTSTHRCIKYKQRSYQHIYKTFKYKQESYQHNRLLWQYKYKCKHKYN